MSRIIVRSETFQTTLVSKYHTLDKKTGKN